MSALSVPARGRNGPGLHTGFLSGRVNTLGSVLNKCHSQRGWSSVQIIPVETLVGPTQLWPVVQV